MIPILYERTEQLFESNGLGRIRDIISCSITEERNGIYEIEFQYPMTGMNYENIQIGRIVAASVNNEDDVQPFDIVSASKPINGIVTFYGTHISYRLNKITVSGTNVNTLAQALTMLEGGTPDNPFSFDSDFESTGYVSAADGTPRTVRQMLGGIEGSILDTYGGEYIFNTWNVILCDHRGQKRTLPIRYGVNLADYNEEIDSSETFTGVIPYWNNGETLIKGSAIYSGGMSVSGREEVVPLDCSDKFEDAPTVAQLESYAVNYLNANQPYLPKQTIDINFVNLADTLEYEDIAPLFDYKLCDTVPVIFPMYGTNAEFKIVKTVYDVLGERYTSMELGTLSTTLAEALGISEGGMMSSGGGGGTVDFDKIYPVGCIYTSTNPTNPTALFGVGTWTPIAEGRVLLSGTESGSYQVGTEYGENTHTLTESELPAISGSATFRGLQRSSDTTNYAINTAAADHFSRDTSGTNNSLKAGTNVTNVPTSKLTFSFGGGQAHNNMQKSLAVYMWERTA